MKTDKVNLKPSHLLIPLIKRLSWNECRQIVSAFVFVFFTFDTFTIVDFFPFEAIKWNLHKVIVHWTFLDMVWICGILYSCVCVCVRKSVSEFVNQYACLFGCALRVFLTSWFSLPTGYGCTDSDNNGGGGGNNIQQQQRRQKWLRDRQHISIE